MAMADDTAITRAKRIENLILTVRGQRVMLDADLARIYGVQLKRLNEQVRRNRERFPEDFAFQLAPQELTNLKSQIATSRSHGGKRKLPWVFTEHGAIMLASVLRIPVDIEASVRVGQHGDAIRLIFAALRQMLELPAPAEEPSKREIGFHVKEARGRDIIRRRVFSDN
jgi:hypothetical protein